MLSEAAVASSLVSPTTTKDEVDEPTDHQSDKRKAENRESDDHNEPKLPGFDFDVFDIVTVETVFDPFE